MDVQPVVASQSQFAGGPAVHVQTSPTQVPGPPAPLSAHRLPWFGELSFMQLPVPRSHESSVHSLPSSQSAADEQPVALQEPSDAHSPIAPLPGTVQVAPVRGVCGVQSGCVAGVQTPGSQHWPSSGHVTGFVSQGFRPAQVTTVDRDLLQSSSPSPPRQVIVTSTPGSAGEHTK